MTSPTLNKMTVEEYLSELASKQPTPGGGAAVAICAAQAVALLSMVLAVSGDEHGEEHIVDLKILLENGRQTFLDLASKDAEAFEHVMACYRLPKNSDEEKTVRKKALQSAFENATEVPFAIMELAVEILDSAAQVIAAGKASVISDAAIGVDFLHSALKASRHNVRINLKYIQDEDFRESAESRMKLLTSGRNKQRKALLAKIQEMMTP